jgi:phosphoserine aminotransferase
MISFYPGPSKVYPLVAEWAAEAVRSGVVSMNHRSPEFMAVTESAIRGLREKLALPADYYVALVSSATECWEIVAQSLTERHSFHPYEGAFGKKWMDYAQKIKPVSKVQQADIVCVVQNETSNGTQVDMNALAQFQQTYPDAILAVDAVSSMAGIVLDWTLADVWFASVQKCFGLPAGLAVLIYSPRALARAEAIGDRNYYNSLLFLHDNFSKFQTPYTPNGLGIYLLSRVLEHVPPIAEIDPITKKRAADWYAFFETEQTHLPFRPLINDRSASETAIRSQTVIALTGTEAAIAAVKKRAKSAGIILGNGYGHWKDTTFRIANFPAISDAEIETLKTFFRGWGR